MARKPRIEIEGGLYHVITRGNDRRDIFHSDDDHRKFLSLLTDQKGRMPFYLYAYCLMSNHVHLLIERRADAVGRIMHRLLTGYSQYYNWRYRRSGHLLEGRHKAILCQNEVYMGELVRYIHLNPVRAKMVDRAEDYPYSSQLAYLGIEPEGIVDVDPVLRLFGAKKKVAREHFARYVTAGLKLGHRQEFYAGENGILGSEEFVDATIHRISDTGRAARPTDGRLSAEPADFDRERLMSAVERVCDLPRDEFCGRGKAARIVAVKEALILAGRRLGATTRTLSEISGLNSSNISRRHDTAQRRMGEDEHLRKTTEKVVNEYRIQR